MSGNSNVQFGKETGYMLGAAGKRRRGGRATIAVGLMVLGWFVTAESASAQMRAGIRAGLSMAGMVTDPEDLGFRNGLIGGGWLRAPLGGAVALQIEGYYVQKGFEETDAQSTAAAWLKLDYFEFPVLLTFLINRGEPRMGYVAVGGAFSVERGCTLGARGEGFSAEVACTQLSQDPNGPGFYPEDFDVSVLLGAGLEFDVGSIIVTLDARADLGLKDAMSFSSGGFDGEYFGGQNVGVQIMAGVAFPLS